MLRSGVYASSNGGAAHTLLNNGSFMLTGAIHALVKAGRFDVIIASSPPFLAVFAAEAVRLTRRVPMVLEMRDLWPDYMVEMGMLKSRVLRKALFGMESYLLRRSQRSVVVMYSTRERVAGKGVPEERIHVMPNGVDLSQYYRSSEPPPLPTLRRSDGESVVGHLGTFGVAQDLRSVVEAAAIVDREAGGVRFVFAGDGREKEEVVERARDRGLSNISFHEPIPKDQTRAFYTSCDVCLVPLADLDVLQEPVPSKIFEIMACETPVLASLRGEAADIVRRSGGTVPERAHGNCRACTPLTDSRGVARTLHVFLLTQDEAFFLSESIEHLLNVLPDHSSVVGCMLFPAGRCRRKRWVVERRHEPWRRLGS